MQEDLQNETLRDAGSDGQDPVARRAPWDLDRTLRWLVVVALLVWAGLFVRHMYFQARLQAHKRNALSNMAGNIKTALWIYASDNQDYFPDAETKREPAPKNSNQAFRRLIENGCVNDEAPFVVKGGAARADNDKSSRERILAKGENHYALAKGLRASSNKYLPLVWEAPLSGSWDPIWDSSRKRKEWGSTWPDGTVLVMTVGGSVTFIEIEPTVAGKKGQGRLAPKEKGQNPFLLKPDGDSLGPEW